MGKPEGETHFFIKEEHGTDYDKYEGKMGKLPLFSLLLDHPDAFTARWNTREMPTDHFFKVACDLIDAVDNLNPKPRPNTRTEIWAGNGIRASQILSRTTYFHNGVTDLQVEGRNGNSARFALDELAWPLNKHIVQRAIGTLRNYDARFSLTDEEIIRINSRFCDISYFPSLGSMVYWSHVPATEALKKAYEQTSRTPVFAEELANALDRYVLPAFAKNLPKGINPLAEPPTISFLDQYYQYTAQAIEQGLTVFDRDKYVDSRLRQSGSLN